jgi:hypothetical protein
MNMHINAEIISSTVLFLIVSGVFTVKDSDVEALSPDFFAEFFRDLLFAEARRLLLPANRVSISLKTNVADGGIDASVEDASLAQNGDIIVDKDSFISSSQAKTLNHGKRL